MVSILELMYCNLQRLPIRIEHSVAINMPMANSLPTAKFLIIKPFIAEFGQINFIIAHVYKTEV